MISFAENHTKEITMNLSKFERYPLTFGPTPIEHLPRLSEAIDADVEMYAKRDDCNSGLALGLSLIHI